jgi:hypothetical protein
MLIHRPTPGIITEEIITWPPTMRAWKKTQLEPPVIGVWTEVRFFCSFKN